jgi:hypothetical protein
MVDPSMNVTVPVGVPSRELTELLTVAVKVTEEP